MSWCVLLLECPITFHARVELTRVATSQVRGFTLGTRMIYGLLSHGIADHVVPGVETLAPLSLTSGRSPTVASTLPLAPTCSKIGRRMRSS